MFGWQSARWYAHESSVNLEANPNQERLDPENGFLIPSKNAFHSDTPIPLQPSPSLPKSLKILNLIKITQNNEKRENHDGILATFPSKWWKLPKPSSHGHFIIFYKKIKWWKECVLTKGGQKIKPLSYRGCFSKNKIVWICL